MKTVTEHTLETYRIKGSKFLGYLFPASTITAFESELSAIKSDHPTATHHCYGWRMNPAKIEEYSQDDGEPSGTAGMPILNRLRSYELINIGLVVVRYYGGTKLGKSGLIEAYGHTADLCIKHSTAVTLLPTQLYKIRFHYGHQNLYDKWKNSYELIEKNAEYFESVTVEVACPVSKNNAFHNELSASEHLLIDYEKLGPSHEIKR